MWIQNLPLCTFFWSKRCWWWEQCQLTQHSPATHTWKQYETHILGTGQESRPDKWETLGSTWPWEGCKWAGLLRPPENPRGYQQAPGRAGRKGNRRRLWQPCLLPSTDWLPALEASSRKPVLGQENRGKEAQRGRGHWKQLPTHCPGWNLNGSKAPQSNSGPFWEWEPKLLNSAKESQPPKEISK